MICPSPFPDEFAPGYLGRVMRLNACRNHNDFRDILLATPLREEFQRSRVRWILILCKMASMSFSDFMKNHTMFMLYRYPLFYEDDTLIIRNRDWFTSLHEVRPATYFCLHCAEEDHERHGMPYWRREHQLPGLYWCLLHNTTLRRTNCTNPFASSPMSCKTLFDADYESWTESIKLNPVVQRYAQIITSILSEQKPLRLSKFVEPTKVVNHDLHWRTARPKLSTRNYHFRRIPHIYELETFVSLSISSGEYDLRHYVETAQNTKIHVAAATINAIVLAIISHTVGKSSNDMYAALENIDQLIGF